MKLQSLSCRFSLWLWIILILFSTNFSLQAQNKSKQDKNQNESKSILIPEEISKKCNFLPFEDRTKIRVARFTRSTSGQDGLDINNFSSMLSNALSEVDCYRVLAMEKDTSDSGSDIDTDREKPQIVVTGEITEYNHSETTTKVMLKTKKTITAKVGFILQLKNPVTSEILYSRSFDKPGLAESSSAGVDVKIGPLGKTTIGSSENTPIEQAYFDAIEQGILDAVTWLVENQGRINEILKGSASGNKITVQIKNASFAKLIEIENIIKTIQGIQKVEKTMKDGVGNIIAVYAGTMDELATNLGVKLGNGVELTGMEGTKITLQVKQ